MRLAGALTATQQTQEHICTHSRTHRPSFDKQAWLPQAVTASMLRWMPKRQLLHCHRLGQSPMREPAPWAKHRNICVNCNSDGHLKWALRCVTSLSSTVPRKKAPRHPR